MELPRGPVAYTCDTQPNPALSELGRGARLLITESTFLRQHVEMRACEANDGDEAGQQATACGVESLALVHIGEGEDMAMEEARAEAATSFSGEVLIPADGDALDV